MSSYKQAGTKLSGVRFNVTYSFFGEEQYALKNAESTCIEQTIEFPPELLPTNEYWSNVKGRLEEFNKLEEQHYLAKISFAIETISPDIIQILNVIYGNISMIPDIRVEDADFPPEMLKFFKGPRFGQSGLRDICGVQNRPLICSTIKPMGLALESFAEIAYESAIGGADIVKDDHGLTDQNFSKFEDRVKKCSQAVLKANAETGSNSLYAPNITAPIDQIINRAHYAKQAGAQALLIIPGLVGWDIVRLLSENSELALPIICHPAYFGIYYSSLRSGFSAQFAYSILPRLVGADVSIFPNYSGRLYSIKQECLNTTIAAKRKIGNIKPVFPAPGGGITLQTIPELVQFYDQDIIYVMGGGLHRGGSLVENCRTFRKLIETKNS